MPDLPMAIITLPQFGSSPAIAVLTRFEFAIEKAIFFASFSFLDLITFTVINLVAPSPSATILLDKLSINFGNIKIIEKGKIFKDYNESEVANYMKDKAIGISINLNLGTKNFTAYTMDLTKKYIEINADYRS